jgi:riboflavin kinase/FMN adenylyltransferase
VIKRPDRQAGQLDVTGGDVIEYVRRGNGSSIIVQVVEELSRVSPERETLLTIGVFDGVHLGHRHLMEMVIREAAGRDLMSGVVTFNGHPKTVLSNGATLARLTTPSERSALLKAIGVDVVVPLSFTAELAALTAREFVSLLIDHLRMRGLIIGPGFAMGRGREGDAAVLSALGQELGFTVEEVGPLEMHGSVVSSTAIREALSRGDMQTASRMLGRHFSLRGPVVGGTERGRVLGFPTANIGVDPDQALPGDGVYATLGHVGDAIYRSVTNIGVRPTFGEGERSVEAFLLDFEGDVYGQDMTIELVERLRGEVKFADAGDLSAQITRDVEQARTVLAQDSSGSGS